MPKQMSVASELNSLSNPGKAKLLSRFFKTGKGEYGEGDVFIGVMVPETRKVVRKHAQSARLSEIASLLDSKVHEHRLAALLLLVEKFKKADDNGKKPIVEFYLKSTSRINNWDLVDLSAHHILGAYLLHNDDVSHSLLFSLARSSNIWERRIAILSTFAFIRENDFADSFAIAEMLLSDKHDLIYKAVGWMLREIGKRDQIAEEKFLDLHYRAMPRTMLRYAIERFDTSKKQHYMRK